MKILFTQFKEVTKHYFVTKFIIFYYIFLLLFKMFTVLITKYVI